jgi:hypothetical protein
MSNAKTSRRRPSSPKLSIEIHQGVIDNAIRRNDNHCMIAEAIHQQVALAKNISVDLATIRWTDVEKNLRYIYLTPRPAQIALIDFDRGVKPTPFRLDLKRAAQIVRGYRHGSSKPKTNEEKLEVNAQNVQIRRNRTTATTGELFRMSTEESNAIIAAMNDPNANLGPASVHVPSKGCLDTAKPVVVGGKAPPPGNLGHSRRFGVRQMVE